MEEEYLIKNKLVNRNLFKHHNIIFFEEEISDDGYIIFLYLSAKSYEEPPLKKIRKIMPAVQVMLIQIKYFPIVSKTEGGRFL